MFVSLLTFWEPVLQMLLLYLKKHVPQIFYYHVKASKQTKESAFLNPLPTWTKKKKTKILCNGIDKAYVFKWDLLLYWKEEGIIPARYKNPKYSFGQRKYNLTTFKSSF